VNLLAETALEADSLPTADRSGWAVRTSVFVSILVWLALVAGGLAYLAQYANEPGPTSPVPDQWPVGSSIQPTSGQATLVMLAHPQCPCTRASIGELAAIMAHCQGRLNAYVLFLKPENSAENWEKTDLWSSAARIPGVTVVSDPNGEQARLFKAATSGQTVLYGLSGQLLFRGGITASRGHSGDNAGRSAIVSIINSELPDVTETNVFGCPLFNSNSECRVPPNELNKR
jgi:hypothetical protein